MTLEPKPTHDLDLDVLPEDDWARTWLPAYIEHIGSINKASTAAHIAHKTARARLQEDPVFRTLKTQCDNALLEALETEAYLRARDGTERPIYQQGRLVGKVREIDNRHLEWLLERLAPEKYHLGTRIELANPGQTAAFTFRMGEEPLELNEAEAQEE